LELAKSGAINLHTSLLPKYRGRAPINWAILNGESELGLTAHWVDAGMDTGDIIMQRKFLLGQDQDVGDALQLLYPIYEYVTEYIIDGFKHETLSRLKQNEAEASVFPRRKPQDGLIDWNRPARDVWNLVRAVAHPYPSAFAPWQGGVLKVHRISGITQFPKGEPPKPGTPAKGNDGINNMHVACLDAFVIISDYTFANHRE
jgi:methionyl-tRNA formyltransferase